MNRTIFIINKQRSVLILEIHRLRGQHLYKTYQGKCILRSPGSPRLPIAIGLCLTSYVIPCASFDKNYTSLYLFKILLENYRANRCRFWFEAYGKYKLLNIWPYSPLPLSFLTLLTGPTMYTCSFFSKFFFTPKHLGKTFLHGDIIHEVLYLYHKIDCPLGFTRLRLFGGANMFIFWGSVKS